MSMIVVLDDPATAAAGARRGQRRHLGRAPQDAPGAGRSRTSWPSTASPSTRSWRRRRRGARRGPAPVLRRPLHRAPAVRSTPPTSGSCVRHVLPIIGAEDLAQVHGRRRETGRPSPLDRRRRLVEDHQPLIGDAVINDGPGLMLIVEKFPWANTLEVTRGVEEALDELEPGLPGIEVDTTIFRPATFIEVAPRQPDQRAAARLHPRGRRSSCVFLFEWRTALISLVAIPLSLVAAGAGALRPRRDDQHDDPGGLRDRARRRRRRRDHRRREHRAPAAPAPPSEGSTRSTAAIVLDASLEVRSAIVFATLIDVVAVVAGLLPRAACPGSFFQPLASPTRLAVLASMVVALTVTPALA